MITVARACRASVVALLFSGIAWAQDSESSRLAKQLALALEAAKAESIAARDPTRHGTYIAALYFSGTELLVVSAQYAVPMLLDQKLVKKEYREIYLDLNGAAVPGTKVFIEDLGADGLKVRPDEHKPADSYEAEGKRTAFTGDWKAQKLSENAYHQAFATAESDYRRMLTALLDQLTKKS